MRPRNLQDYNWNASIRPERLTPADIELLSENTLGVLLELQELHRQERNGARILNLILSKQQN